MTVPVLAVNKCYIVSTSQTKKVTINKTDAPVKEILEEIKRQTNFDFVINAKFITDLGKRTLKVNDVTVDEALLSLLQGTKYKYQIVNNHITFVLENFPPKKYWERNHYYKRNGNRCQPKHATRSNHSVGRHHDRNFNKLGRKLRVRNSPTGEK